MSRFRCFRLLAGCVCVLALSVLPGCLINIGGTKVVEPSAERMPVDFESEEGMKAFVRQVAQRYPAERNAGGGYFGVPFLIGVSEQRVLSENAHFNTAVRQVDLNADGTLSDAELEASGYGVPGIGI
ncbi:MAG: hypothetical protein AAGJ38_01625 [Planctomycetota bacterium]